jgi:hypothetical protein
MQNQCPYCNREFKTIWEYPLIELIQIEKVAPKEISDVLTLSNEETSLSFKRSCAESVVRVFRNIFATPSFLDGLAVAPTPTLEYFLKNPKAERFLDEEGRVYTPHKNYARALTCAPNRAPEIKKALFGDFAFKDYIARLEQMINKIIEPALLNPGFSDFFELPRVGNTSAQFLSLFLEQDVAKRQVYLNVGVEGVQARSVLFREVEAPILKVATISYKAVF